MAYKRSLRSFKRRRSYARNFARGRTSSRVRSVRAPVASRRRLRAIANLRTGGQLGIETKYLDTYLAPSVVSNTPSGTGSKGIPSDSTMPVTVVPITGSPVASVYWLNCPPVGSDADSRDGRVITNRSIEISGEVYQNTVPYGSGIVNICIALVLDTQANAATPAASGPLVYYNPSGAVSGLSLPLRDMTQGSRFRVLSSQRFNLNPSDIRIVSDTVGGYSTQALVVRPFKIYKKLGFKTHFTAASTAPAVGNIVDNGLFLLAWSDSTTAYIHFNARLRFVG